MAAELIHQYEPNIESITLLPADGGRYEITVDGKLVYSKLATGRHAEPGEVEKLVGNIVYAGR